MKVVETVSDWQQIRKLIDQKIGFVPTMGALHEGHLSLVDQAKEKNDVVVMSIYLNPTQFDQKEDLNKYPVSWQKDLQLAEERGVNYIFAPNYEEMYPLNFRYKVTETEFSNELCGASRPGHFDGVLTVVLKLLNIIKPNQAFFGEKDFQQLQLIKDMCRSLFIDCEIIGCPIVRESDGLAMSSRNRRLSQEDRKKAAQLAKILCNAKTDNEAKVSLEENGFEIDYVESHFNRRFGAVHIGPNENRVRLIDNVTI